MTLVFELLNLKFLFQAQFVEIDSQIDWTVITSFYLTQNQSLGHRLHEPLVHKKVIESFPYVFLPISVFDLPPSIFAFHRIESSVGVDPPFIQEMFETSSLLIGETGLFVGVGSDVDV